MSCSQVHQPTSSWIQILLLLPDLDSRHMSVGEPDFHDVTYNELSK